MTENSDSLENSVVERVNGILSPYTVRSLNEAAQHLERAVFLYNYKHPHLSCAMQSPNEATVIGATGTALEKLL